MGFGPRIVGKDNYQATVASKRGTGGFGHRVTGKAAPAKAAAFQRPQTPAPKQPEGISLAALTHALTENPTLFDALYEQELARAEGPRADALRALAKHANPEALAEIDELLAASEPKSETRETGEGHGDDLDALNFKSLKALAVEREIDEPALNSRAKVIAAIRAHDETKKSAEPETV